MEVVINFQIRSLIHYEMKQVKNGKGTE